MKFFYLFLLFGGEITFDVKCLSQLLRCHYCGGIFNTTIYYGFYFKYKRGSPSIIMATFLQHVARSSRLSRKLAAYVNLFFHYLRWSGGGSINIHTRIRRKSISFGTSSNCESQADSINLTVKGDRLPGISSSYGSFYFTHAENKF